MRRTSNIDVYEYHDGLDGEFTLSMKNATLYLTNCAAL